MRAWINLLDDTGDSFPVIYPAMRKFLVPVETNDHPFYRFTRDISDEKPITVQQPETTLDLMDKVTSDARFLRLIDLVERS